MGEARRRKLAGFPRVKSRQQPALRSAEEVERDMREKMSLSALTSAVIDFINECDRDLERKAQFRAQKERLNG